MKLKCRNDKHRPEFGKCKQCGDVFPCPDECNHDDCIEAREACCERGWRYAMDTEDKPTNHPGDCSNA